MPSYKRIPARAVEQRALGRVIEAVERLPAPSPEADRLIVLALGYRLAAGQAVPMLETGAGLEAIPGFTELVDQAWRLVPEDVVVGCVREISRSDQHDPLRAHGMGGFATIHRIRYGKSPERFAALGMSPALALTAAALKCVLVTVTTAA
jgi:hypothetical protein